MIPPQNSSTSSSRFLFLMYACNPASESAAITMLRGAKIPKDFALESGWIAPSISLPSTRKKLGFFSAPTSPCRAPAYYDDDFSIAWTENNQRLSAVPFNWEEKPGIPKARKNGVIDDDEIEDYAFEFSGPLEKTTCLPADELFDGGIVRPLTPPPRLEVKNLAADSCSPKSPRSPTLRTFSPKPKKKYLDPFAVALELEQSRITDLEEPPRGSNFAKHLSSSRNKGTRSLSVSPLRFSDLLLESPNNRNINQAKTKTTLSKRYRNWKVKNLFIFRNRRHASKRKDEIKKIEALKKSSQEDEDWSFKSIESLGLSFSSSNQGTNFTAHELQYTTDEAEAVPDEMKKTTLMFYQKNIFACFGLNLNKHVPVHAILKGPEAR